MTKTGNARQKRVVQKPGHPGLAKQNLPATALDVRERIGVLVSENGTLLAVSEKTKINVGYLSQIMRGKRRASNKVLSALGLPCYAPAPVCPKHGVVHAGQCPRAARVPKDLWDWPVKALRDAIRNRS
jgi:hypothetical protein